VSGNQATARQAKQTKARRAEGKPGKRKAPKPKAKRRQNADSSAVWERIASRVD
jgi:hypothetical protein